MKAMNIQERYDEIAELSGLSEQVVRRVIKAAQTSLNRSLKQGGSATLPGICTLYPEIRSRIDAGGRSSTKYVKIKAKASSALETEFQKIQSFNQESLQQSESYDDIDLSSILYLEKPELHGKDKNKSAPETEQKPLLENRYEPKVGVRVAQISALT